MQLWCIQVHVTHDSNFYCIDFPFGTTSSPPVKNLETSSSSSGHQALSTTRKQLSEKSRPSVTLTHNLWANSEDRL